MPANSPGPRGLAGWGWGSCGQSLTPRWAKLQLSQAGKSPPTDLPGLAAAQRGPAPRLQPGSLHSTLLPAPRPASPPWSLPSTPRPHQHPGGHLGPCTRRRTRPSLHSASACSPIRALGSWDTLLPTRARSPPPRPRQSCYLSPHPGVVHPGKGVRTCWERVPVPASLAPLCRTASWPREAARISG